MTTFQIVILLFAILAIVFDEVKPQLVTVPKLFAVTLILFFVWNK